jgi:flagellar biogenesis protein FliO
MASSLAVVLVVFFALMALLRRGLPAQGGKLPLPVLEVLGHSTIGGKQQLHLVRCGHKLLLTCTTTAGMQTLTEIDEPAEVERLAALCRGTGAREPITARKKQSDPLGVELGQDPAQHSFVRGLYRESTRAMS